MANVSINLVYNKLLQVEREVRELRTALIPEVGISKKEHKELDAVLSEMKRGKETNWRDVYKA